MSFKNGFYAGILAAFFIGLWLIRLWSAENQVRLHSEHLIRAVEKRKWSAVESFLASDYGDDWGNDRSSLVSQMRLALHSFSSLTISESGVQVHLTPREGSWSARIHLAGGGSEEAPEIIARVNSLTSPFELRWRRESAWPWDWKLMRVGNARLQIISDVY